MESLTIQSAVSTAKLCGDLLKDSSFAEFFDQEYTDTWVLKQGAVPDEEGPEEFVNSVKDFLTRSGVEINSNLL